jgi:hypothetical protein
MTVIETEHERKVREYWANAYKGKIKNSIYDLGSLDLTNNDGDNSNNTKLPYEPTAVLTSQRNARKPITLRELLDIDIRSD